MSIEEVYLRMAPESIFQPSPRKTAMTLLHHIPHRYAPTLVALLMSGTMSGVMSLTLTAINAGLGPELLARWLDAWTLAFALAFPLVLLLSPRVRTLVAALTD
jgi:hypothetical protein